MSLAVEQEADDGTHKGCKWLQPLESAIVGLELTTGLNPGMPTDFGLPKHHGFGVGQDIGADQAAELVQP